MIYDWNKALGTHFYLPIDTNNNFLLESPCFGKITQFEPSETGIIRAEAWASLPGKIGTSEHDCQDFRPDEIEEAKQWVEDKLPKLIKRIAIDYQTRLDNFVDRYTPN